MLHLPLAVALALSSAQTESSTPPENTATDPAPASTPETSALESLEPGIQEFDIQPSVEVVRSGTTDVRLGGLVQVHASPYVGEDALLENGDPANGPGFRMRRVRFGASARFGERFGLLIGVNPLETDDEVGTLSDAQLTFDFADYLRLSVGTSKVPFSRGALVSGRTLAFIERPLSVGAIVPTRRLGIAAEGALLGGKLGYLVGVMNGTEGFEAGNFSGGVLFGARIEGGLGVVDGFRPTAKGFRVAVNAVTENGPTDTTFAYGADAQVGGFGATLQLEYLCDEKKPRRDPVRSPTLSAVTQRCGMYAEATYAMPIPKLPLQLAVRGELFDDNKALEDAGDAVLFQAGVNFWVVKDRARAQLHYLARREQHSVERQNDAVVLNLQGSF